MNKEKQQEIEKLEEYKVLTYQIQIQTEEALVVQIIKKIIK